MALQTYHRASVHLQSRNHYIAKQSNISQNIFGLIDSLNRAFFIQKYGLKNIKRELFFTFLLCHGTP